MGGKWQEWKGEWRGRRGRGGVYIWCHIATSQCPLKHESEYSRHCTVSVHCVSTCQ